MIDKIKVLSDFIEETEKRKIELLNDITKELNARRRDALKAICDKLDEIAKTVAGITKSTGELRVYVGTTLKGYNCYITFGYQSINSPQDIATYWTFNLAHTDNHITIPDVGIPDKLKKWDIFIKASSKEKYHETYHLEMCCIIWLIENWAECKALIEEAIIDKFNEETEDITKKCKDAITSLSRLIDFKA